MERNPSCEARGVSLRRSLMLAASPFHFYSAASRGYDYFAMKKTILVFTTSYIPFIGGAEIAVQEVSRRLCDAYDFYIITARRSRALARREIVPEGTIIRVGFGSFLDVWLLPFFGFFAVISLALQHTIPKPWKRNAGRNLLLWGMDIGQGSLCARMLKTFFPRIPFVLTVQYGYGDDRLAKGRRGLIGKMFRFMLAGADATSAISTYLRESIKAYGFLGAANIIPNGVDTDIFSFQKNQQKANYQQRVIITTSRLVEKNGIDILIRAMADVKKTFPATKCHIIGDGIARGALQKLASDLNLNQDIIFFGSVPYEEIPFYLKKADVFVRPSRSEGMGNSFVEALSVGLPVIGTSVGGIPDIIRDCETGLLCNIDDPQDLAEKICSIFKNPALVAHMQERGRQLVEEKFSWNSIAHSYKQLFESVLHARSRVLIATPLYPPEIGGPATYTKLLGDHLLNSEIIVRIVRFNDFRHLPTIARHAAFAWRVFWQARFADIIFAQDPVSTGFPASLAALARHKIFLLKIVGDYAWEQGMQRFGVHDLLDVFLQKTYGRRIEWLRALQRFSAQRAAAIIAPSNYLKRVVEQWGVAGEKIHVIANAFEMPDYAMPREQAKKMLGISGRLLVSSGRLVPWKGFDTLIDAMADVARHDTDLLLVIIGSGPMEKELQQRIAAHGLESRVQLAGSVDHDTMLSYIAAADVFVLNTGYEGFSHALLEAMAMGAPVVTSDRGGNSELIIHDKNGFLISYNDTQELVAAIIAVLDMPAAEKNKLITAAKETARQFSKERMIRETADLLKNV